MNETTGQMRLGVVSDTHGQVSSTLAAVRMLETFAVDRVLHCGDIGTGEIVGLFARWPTHFVLGNVDDDRELSEAIRAAGQTCHERFGALEWLGRRIALLHGDDTRRLDETIRSGRYDLVCHGHTHRAKEQRVGSTLVLNPGALHRAKPHSLAIVELPALEAVTISLGSE